MAYVDRQLSFSSAQRVTANGSSTDTIDLGNANIDVGTGENVYLIVNVTRVEGSGSMTASLQESTSATGSFSTVPGLSTGTINAVGSTKLRVPVGTADQRFLRLSFSGHSGTAVTIDAYLAIDVDQYKAYPSGYKVGA